MLSFLFFLKTSLTAMVSGGTKKGKTQTKVVHYGPSGLEFKSITQKGKKGPNRFYYRQENTVPNSFYYRIDKK
jgi:hypothetical protein